MTYEYVAWPAWCTGPNGETRVFDREEDVPKGWTHHGDGAASEDIGSLRAAYKAKFGNKPFGGWDAPELRKRLG